MRVPTLLSAFVLLGSAALFAQHPSVVPSSPPAAVTSVHTGAAAPSVPHSVVSAAHGVTPISHQAAQTSHGVNVANRASMSGAKPVAEKHSWFAWLRKREPTRGRTTIEHPQYLAETNGQSLFVKHHGCLIVPVTNPAIPCNPFAPCCQ
jgi:hypothetical protein